MRMACGVLCARFCFLPVIDNYYRDGTRLNEARSRNEKCSLCVHACLGEARGDALWFGSWCHSGMALFAQVCDLIAGVMSWAKHMFGIFNMCWRK